MIKLKKNAIIKNELEEFLYWDNKRYIKRNDEENILPIGISDKEFVNIITDLFFGKNWHAIAPMSHDQINEVILKDIIWKFIEKNKGVEV